MNEIELYKRLDRIAVTFEKIEEHLEVLADTSRAMRNCIDSNMGVIKTATRG